MTFDLLHGQFIGEYWQVIFAYDRYHAYSILKEIPMTESSHYKKIPVIPLTIILSVTSWVMIGFTVFMMK